MTEAAGGGVDRATRAAFRRSLPAMVVVFAVVFGAGLLVTALGQPSYETEARVLVRTEANQGLFPLGDGIGPVLTRQMDAEAQYILADQYLGEAIRSSGSTPGAVDAEVLRDERDQLTATISFRATAPTREEAAHWANTWAGVYVAQRHELDVADHDASLSSIRETASELQAQRDEIVEVLEPLDAAIAVTRNPEALARLVAQRASVLQSLSPELAPIDSQLGLLETQLAELEVTRGFLDNPEISAMVLRSPRSDSPQSDRNWAMTILLSAALALVLAAAYGWARNNWTGEIHDLDQAAGAAGAPGLAALPKRARDDRGLITSRPQAAAEANQRMVTAVDFVLSDSGARCVLVTSGTAGVGKSMVAADLAGISGRQGIKTILVDGDARMATVHERLGIDNERGLTSVLTGRDDLSVVVHTADEITVLPAGPPIDNPAELLRGAECFRLFTELGRRFDRIVVDAPPVLAVTDAEALQRCVDATVLVARAGQSRREDVAGASRRIRQAGGLVIGVVLTHVQGQRRHYQRYVSSRG